MISHLSGKVLSLHERSLTLATGGVGYLVTLTRSVLEKISAGQDLEFFIHTNVREDDISLYGFPTEEEWKFFRLLLTVTGIGPKSAMEIMNAPLQRVRTAIAKKDAAALSQIPGIGKKTAERLCLELQGKVHEELLGENVAPEMQGGNEDIIAALVSLGYSRQQATRGLQKIPKEIQEEEAIIKYFLQHS